jgi:hypothetical protein
MHLFAGIPVASYETSVTWYEKLFGRPPTMLPKEGEAVWRLSPEASVYIVEDARRAGNALVTIADPELDTDRRVVEDPDGNTLQFFRA